MNSYLFTTELSIFVKICPIVINEWSSKFYFPEACFLAYFCGVDFDVSVDVIVALAKQNGVQQRKSCFEMPSRETPDFISPSRWPPNSLDLNPVDYAIWGLLQHANPRRRPPRGGVVQV